MKQDYFLSKLFLVFILLLSAFKIEAVEKTLGYCPDEIPDNVKKVGNAGQSNYVSSGIKLPTATLAGMKGNKITKIRFAIGAGMSNVRVWIRRGDLSSTPVLLESAGATVEGWNEVKLSTPYTIDGSDLYVGYSGRQPSSNLVIWLAGDDNPNATFINDGSWYDYYGKGWGSLLIQAVVEGDNFADNDLALENLATDSTYYRTGGTAKISFSVANTGKKDAESAALSWQIDNAQPVAAGTTGALSSGQRTKLSADVNLDNVAEGVHTLRVFITQPQGSADVVANNDTIERKLLVYQNTYKKKVLLEQFTTIPCVNCPYGDAVLALATKNRDDVVWVAHHSGFRTDELTIAESEKLLAFGVNGAPMAMLNRVVTPISQQQGIAPFSIGYTNAQAGGDYVSQMMDYCAARTAMADVQVKCDYNEASRLLTVTTTGTCNGIFTSLVPQTALSIMLTENNVYAKQVQVGTQDEHIHSHVLRAMLTNAFGDDLTWNGNTFESVKTITLDKAWKPADMYVAAFISIPYATGGATGSEVINSTSTPVGNVLGITTATTNKPTVTIVNGLVKVNGSYNFVEVYTADGARVAPNNLAHGLYIVKVGTTAGVATRKIAY